jgi:hypothetical protein
MYIHVHCMNDIMRWQAPVTYHGKNPNSTLSELAYRSWKISFRAFRIGTLTRVHVYEHLLLKLYIKISQK